MHQLVEWSQRMAGGGGGMGTEFLEREQDAGSQSQSNDELDRVSIDDAIEYHVSAFGWMQYVAAALAWVPSAPLTLLLVFTARTPSIKCEKSPCTLSSICSMSPDSWHFTNPSESIVSEFNLICSRAYLRSLLNSGFFAAFFVGCTLTGLLADSFGRRNALLLCVLSAAFLTSLSGVASSFWLFATARMLTGLPAAGIGLASFVLSTEHIASPSRGPAGIATQYFWATGLTLLPLLAFACDSIPESLSPLTGWRGLTHAVALLNVLYAISITPPCGLLRESPRWLTIQGKLDSAHAVLKSIAPVNTVIPPLTQYDESGQGENQSNTLLVLRKYPNLALRLLGMMTEWMVISLGYYGLSLGVGQLGPNLYLTSLLSGLVEVPAYLLTNGLIDFFGRRNSLMLQLVLSGACCMAAAFSTSNTRTAVSLIGKFGVAGAFNILFLFTTELFPTSVRTAALGGCSQAARLGSIVAPPVLALKSVHPLLIIGIGILLAGTITLAFPEPLGAPPPESLETAEAARIPHPLERPSAQSTTSIEEGEKAYGKRLSDPSLRYEEDEDIANEQARQHQRLLEQVERTNTTDPSSE